ncbi:MAG: MoxR family ATPase [Myxococcales bacterium]|nr:MoxR family ATPase [Myxococcales bacterium]
MSHESSIEPNPCFASPDEVVSVLGEHDYVAGDALAMSVFLALKMGRPLFLEGAPGVGKTLLAQTLAAVFDTELVRLQCHEGLDLAQAAYEWNYPKQLLTLQAQRDGSASADSVFTQEFLLARPLLKAIDASTNGSVVLLIDELDRADEEFESFLLELLSEFQITVPELGTVRARHRPLVVLTSNRTRDVHDALKRRCVYHWIDYPALEDEVGIVRRKVPGLPDGLRQQVVRFVQRLRQEELHKVPGVAETVDWSEALTHLEVSDLDEAAVDATLGVLLKASDDHARMRAGLSEAVLAELSTEEG